MIYKKFKDIELSALGMGAMGLPVVKGSPWRSSGGRENLKMKGHT